ncbi:hypothetical protein C8R45DRAFT_946555 [Mycena sanguinolenta]|nr:hypothetical protein C8R45DRAFT_946555 [Mycena sanguinolenta]
MAMINYLVALRLHRTAPVSLRLLSQIDPRVALLCSGYRLHAKGTSTFSDLNGNCSAQARFSLWSRPRLGTSDVVHNHVLRPSHFARTVLTVVTLWAWNTRYQPLRILSTRLRGIGGQGGPGNGGVGGAGGSAEGPQFNVSSAENWNPGNLNPQGSPEARNRAFPTRSSPLFISTAARVSNIDSATTKDGLLNFFQSKGLAIAPRRHTPLVADANGLRTLVISFADYLTRNSVAGVRF